MFVKMMIDTKSKTNLLQTGAQTHTGAAYDKNNNNNNNTKKDGRDETRRQTYGKQLRELTSSGNGLRRCTAGEW
jgi:hypothetical protein